MPEPITITVAHDEDDILIDTCKNLLNQLEEQNDPSNHDEIRDIKEK